MPKLDVHNQPPVTFATSGLNSMFQESLPTIFPGTGLPPLATCGFGASGSFFRAPPAVRHAYRHRRQSTTEYCELVLFSRVSLAWKVLYPPPRTATTKRRCHLGQRGQRRDLI